MPTRVKAPQAPLLADLTTMPRLGSSDFSDEDVVTGQDIAAVSLDQHHVEFGELLESAIRGGTMADSQWYRARWADVALTDVDLANVAMDQSGLQRVAVRQSRMTGVAWAASTLSDVQFEDCILDLASFRGCTLRRVRFVGCRLTGAHLGDVTAEDVSFDDCDLSRAQLQGMRLSRVSIRGTSLTDLSGVTELAGATVSPVDPLEFAAQLAAALRITIEE